MSKAKKARALFSSFIWNFITLAVGIIQIVIVIFAQMLKNIAFKTTVVAIISDFGVMFFALALVASLVIEYFFEDEFHLTSKGSLALVIFMPIILFAVSIVLYLAKYYQQVGNYDLFYSTEIVLIVAALLYSLIIKAVFMYKMQMFKEKKNA